ncbi:MAG: T9SS type A sorting domain-containing protein, partial [Bacteroidota bacterium]
AEGPKILRTDNLGQSWYDISGFGTNTSSANGFPDVALNDLLVMPHDTSVIWAGTDIGIVESTDAGQSWHLLISNMPAAAIWEMKIVDKEIVMGTHGRGIWTTTIDALPGHVYLPEIVSSIPTLAGELMLNLEMKSAFDSTHLYLNGQLFGKLNQPSEVGKLKLVTNYSAMQSGTAYVRSFYNGVPYVSHVYNYELFNYNDAVDSYQNNFETATNDFDGYGFSEEVYFGFENAAIHSEHSHKANIEYEYILKTPIKVKSANALINFDEVVIVEPGISGAAPGTPEFKDYVVVQGSVDGKTWANLLDEYDASADEKWLSLYGNFYTGNSSHFRFRSIDLLNTFQPNDEILIRFVLVSDSENNGWGWAIDNLRIQTPGVLTGIEDIIVDRQFSVYPNPIASDAFTVAGDAEFGARLLMFDTQGQLMLDKELNTTDVTRIQLPWYVADGLYVLNINSGLHKETHRILINRH